jgi:hypothetical protein
VSDSLHPAPNGITHREEIARARRRQEALDSLEFEREREAALRGRLEPVLRDAEAWRVDEAALAQLSPEDKETLREIGFAQPRPADDAAARFEAQISQLEEQIAESQRRQRALEAYANALEP